jgi:ABC-type uncharacterized transport system substrate-binding protein
MKRLLLSTIFGLAALGLFLWAPAAVWADDVVAVLSSNLKPYQETLAGLQQALGYPVSVLYLSDHKPSIPAGTQVVVAIGGEAALQNYPRDIPLIYCVAPGIVLPANERKAPTTKIYMTPSGSVVLNEIKALQPHLKSLGIIGLAERRDAFDVELQEAGKALGIQVWVEKMKTPNELPDHLRSLRPHIDALWIPPDPRLITRQNFSLIKEFCLANRIAFYVPTIELADQGATASVAASFDDMGRTAGLMVKALMKGQAQSAKVYPAQPRIAINLKAAADIGLEISSGQIEKADKVAR